MDEVVLKAQSAVRQLVFIFHGYGSNKDDLVSVGEAFSEASPSSEVHLPNGIEKCKESFGYQWFPLIGEDIKNWEKAFEEKANELISYMDTVIAEKNLDFKNVVLAGFSQGAMLSLSLGLRLGVKGVIAFSGLLLSPAISLSKKNTKVLLTHGIQDDVIPISAMHLTENALKNSGIEVRTAVSANLG
ncbi:MAG: dienelactone hydrolase family protein, partial [Alphaproteobacteria bacterium]|nr:dienelactone hydrolase family protein [Alphaproteobacteria bacterium]